MTRVLIVDDAAFMRMIVKDIFLGNGFDVVGQGGNGREAVQLYGELRPDLVTMDITMPEMDGIEAVKSIIEIDPDAKIIMVSAMGQQQLIMEALEAGACDFIVKPFQPAKVLEVVSKCLGSKN